MHILSHDSHSFSVEKLRKQKNEKITKTTNKIAKTYLNSERKHVGAT